MKNLKKFAKKNAVTLTVIPLALLLVLGAFGFVKAQLVPQTVVIENVEHLVMNVASGLGEMAFGAITQDKSTFDHGIEILSNGLDVTGATTMTGALNVSRLTQGGTILATSTDGITTSVLTEAQLIANASIDFTLSTEATHTLTLPATSTMTTFIPTAGDVAIMRIRVLGTAASASSTITAGTGIDLIEDEGNDVVIEAGNEAYLRFHRESDTDVTVSVTEYIAAD